MLWLAVVAFFPSAPANAAMLGDFNANQNIDLGDAVLCQQVIAGLAPEGIVLQIESDINADGRIGLEDAVYCLQVLADIRNHPDIDDDQDSFTENQGDCDDTEKAIYPGAPETCGDGIDQDCDGSDLATLSCTDIAGNWAGNYTEYHCSGVRVDDSFSMVIRNDCSFTRYFWFATLSGTWTISNCTIRSTVDPGSCGLYTEIATVSGDEMFGTISSTGGSSGTFYFQKTN